MSEMVELTIALHVHLIQICHDTFHESACHGHSSTCWCGRSDCMTCRPPSRRACTLNVGFCESKSNKMCVVEERERAPKSQKDKDKDAPHAACRAQRAPGTGQRREGVAFAVICDGHGRVFLLHRHFHFVLAFLVSAVHLVLGSVWCMHCHSEETKEREGKKSEAVSTAEI